MGFELNDKKEISYSATTWTSHRERGSGHEILFLQLCRYISMTYSINGGMTELCCTHDKTGDMDYIIIQELQIAKVVLTAES